MKILGRSTPWIALLAALAAPLAQADMTLSQAYQATLDYNARLQGERANVRAEQASIDEAWSGVKPQLHANATYGWSRSQKEVDKNALKPNAPVNMRWEPYSDTFDRYDVSLKQVIYSHQSFTAISRAKRSAELAQVQAQSVESDTGIEVVSAYIDVVTSRRTQQILMAEKESHLYRLKQMEEKLGRGLTTLAEVLDARAEVDQINARLVEIENNHKVALQRLSQLTGQAVNDVAELNESSWKEIPQRLQRDWLQDALEYAPQVRRAEAEVDLAEATHSYENASHYPELHLAGSYVENDSLFATVREESKVEFQLSIPLYTGGSSSARSRAAAEREAKALAMLDYARRQVKTDVESLTSQLQGLHDNIEALFKSLASSQAAENAAEEGFRAGVRRLQELLDAQQRRSQVEQKLVTAIYTSSLRYAELLSLAGELNSDSLQQL